MKSLKNYALLVALLMTTFTYAQNQNVGIGTTTPDPSAVLDIHSTNKGLLIPRMTQTQRDQISNPAEGLIVYQTDQSTGFYYYDGTRFIHLKPRDRLFLKLGENIVNTDGINTNFIFGSSQIDEAFSQYDSRMVFHKDSSAFRVGIATGSEWNEVNLGKGSFGAGMNVRALGKTSIAMGESTYANGENNVIIGQFGSTDSANAVSIGKANTVFGENAAAFGNANAIFGERSAAIGSGNLLSTQNSFALGFNNEIDSSYSTALGIDNEITGYGSSILGYYNFVNSEYSAALGVDNQVDGNYAMSLGASSKALADHSYALGRNIMNTSSNAVVVGTFNDTITNRFDAKSATSPVFVVGNGTTSTQRSNALVIQHNGNVGIGVNDPAVRIDAAGSARLTQKDSPYLRLRQQGGNFGNYTWDVSGNEANFFIRDVSGSGNLPFRIKAGSEENGITISDTTIGIRLPSTSNSIPKATHTLDVNGQIRMRRGAQDGYLPISDSLGAMHWTHPDSLSLNRTDNLGNHTLDSNLRLNGFRISNDGDDEGIKINNNGQVGVNMNPGSELSVDGRMQIRSDNPVLWFHDNVGSQDRGLYLETQFNNGNNSDDADHQLIFKFWTLNGNFGNVEVPFVFRADGRMGVNLNIGDSPTRNLSVQGNGYFSTKLAVGKTTNNGSSQFTVNGSADISGNLGVGTSAPDNKLTVDGDADVTGNLGIGTASPNSSLHVDGSMSLAIKTISGNYTATANDYIIVGNFSIPTANNITLPLSSTCKGRVYVIKKVPGSFKADPDVLASTGDSIEGLPAINVNNSVKLVSDGSQWLVLNIL